MPSAPIDPRQGSTEFQVIWDGNGELGDLAHEFFQQYAQFIAASGGKAHYEALCPGLPSYLWPEEMIERAVREMPRVVTEALKDDAWSMVWESHFRLMYDLSVLHEVPLECHDRGETDALLRHVFGPRLVASHVADFTGRHGETVINVMGAVIGMIVFKKMSHSKSAMKTVMSTMAGVGLPEQMTSGSASWLSKRSIKWLAGHVGAQAREYFRNRATLRESVGAVVEVLRDQPTEIAETALRACQLLVEADGHRDQRELYLLRFVHAGLGHNVSTAGVRSGEGALVDVESALRSITSERVRVNLAFLFRQFVIADGDVGAKELGVLGRFHSALGESLDLTATEEEAFRLGYQSRWRKAQRGVVVAKRKLLGGVESTWRRLPFVGKRNETPKQST